MPHIKQAAKRHRQSLGRQAANKARASAMRSQIKKTQDVIKSGDVAQAKAALSLAMQKIDKAAKHGTIHKNTASRRKSALSRQLRDLESGKKK